MNTYTLFHIVFIHFCYYGVNAYWFCCCYSILVIAGLMNSGNSEEAVLFSFSFLILYNQVVTLREEGGDVRRLQVVPTSSQSSILWPQVDPNLVLFSRGWVHLYWRNSLLTQRMGVIFSQIILPSGVELASSVGHSRHDWAKVLWSNIVEQHNTAHSANTACWKLLL